MNARTSRHRRGTLTIITMLLLAAARPARAAVVFVCDAGNGSAPASAETATAFPTIGAALAALNPEDGPDTVVVYPTVRGPAYGETLVLAPGMTLISAGEFFGIAGDSTPVIAAGAGTIIRGADSATLRGFQLDGLAREKGHWGVHLPGVAGMTVTNLTVRNCEYGFHLNRAGDNRLAGNLAADNDCGFVLTSSPGNRLQSNRSARNAWYGYVLSMSDSNLLTGNRGEQNGRAGFWLARSDHNTLERNHSVANAGDGFYLHTANDNRVTANRSAANAGFAFTLAGNTRGGSWAGNTIVPGDSDSRHGVFCERGEAPLTFTDCYWSTAEENAIAAMLQGPGASAVVWRPYRDHPIAEADDEPRDHGPEPEPEQ